MPQLRCLRKLSKWILKSGTFLLLSSAILWGCLTQIDIEFPESGAEKLSMQGKLVVGNPSRIQVRISRLFEFTAASKQPINARSVKLFDEDGRSVELEGDNLGNYFLTIPQDDPDFSVELEKNYYIQLNTFDGRTFESKLEKASAVPEQDQLTFDLVDLPALDALGRLTPKEHIQFYLSTPLTTSENASKPRLRWLLEWTFKVLDTPIVDGVEPKTCYVTQQLRVHSTDILNSEQLADNYLEDRVIFNNIVFRNFARGLYFTVIQESLSETAFEYFDQVGQNLDRSGNMFESPPGAIVSNIRNVNDETDEAFGFFYVTHQDTIRTYVNPKQVGSPPFYCPPPNGIYTQSGNCADLICCDCLSAEVSTTQVPEYWEE